VISVIYRHLLDSYLSRDNPDLWCIGMKMGSLDKERKDVIG